MSDLISVVIPVKNEGITLIRCLNSLDFLGKNRRIECIVVGDLEFISYANKFENVIVVLFYEPSLKLKDAVNFGIRQARGNIILKIDADIILPENFFDTMVPLLEEYDLVSCPKITRSGKWWLDFFFWLRDLNLKIAPLGRSTHGSSMLFKRSLIDEIGEVEEHGMAHDTVFHKKVLESGKKVYVEDSIKTLEFREDFTIRRIIKRQIEAGVERKKLKIGFWRTLLHSIFRGRIFVVIGWLKEWLR